MKFAKKTMAWLMAAVMLLTSFSTCITAFAAAHTFTATTGVNQSFAAQPYVTTVTDEDGDIYESVSNNKSYFSFTPAATGTYALKVDTAPMYRTYDRTTGRYLYSQTAVAGSQRIDSAYVYVYEDAELNDYVAYASPAYLTTNYYYDAEYDWMRSDVTSLRTYSGYSTFNLIGGKTYYLEAYAGFDWEWVWDANTQQSTRVFQNTQASFSITPVDWTYSTDYHKVSEQKIALPANYDGDYTDEAERNADGSLYVTRTIYDYTVSTRYVGSGADVIVPETINGFKVAGVYGTDNKMIKSLTLSSSVESVSGFSNLKYLSAVNLCNAKEIGSFAGDTALTAVSIPATVKAIEGSSFYNCSSLSSLSIAEGVKSIGSYAFYGTALRAAVIPASVKSIGSYAFGYETNFDTNTVDPYDTTDTAVSGFIVGGYAGTEAESYAALNGFAFCDQTNGCSHVYSTVTTPATLFAKGSRVTTCAVCGASSKKSIKKKTFKIKSLKSSKKGALTVKTAKQSGITGYQIQYSTSNKFTKKTTKTVTVKTTKALSKSIKGLTSGKKYYVRVRAYSKASGKTVYSAYTSAKSVKVK